MDYAAFQFLAPEIALAMVAMIILIAGLLMPHKRILGLLALWGVTLAFFVLMGSSYSSGALFSGMLTNDTLSMFFRILSLLIAGLVILLSFDYKDVDDEDRGEYYFFVLVITLFMMVAVSANNLMMIYITLESISLLSYIMAGYMKRDMFSSEAGLKYFLFGAVSTGITLYGISLVYGLFGTLDLSLIGAHLAHSPVSLPVLLLVSILVLVGFGFKCSLVPFHMWTPDVYQGAPTPVAAFFSVGPKAVGFAFLLRVLTFTFFPFMSDAGIILCVLIAVLTITIGNVIAVQQTNIKRLLAYSTIAQAGYMFIGLATGTIAGIQAILFYLFVYALMNLGAFGVVIAVSNAIKSEEIDEYAGLYERAPFLAVALAVCLLSLGGIPPLAGFFAKFFIFAAAIAKGLTGLVIIAALNSVVALYYYIRIIKVAFLQPAKDKTPIPQPKALVLAMGFIMAGIFILGLWPHLLLGLLSIN